MKCKIFVGGVGAPVDFKPPLLASECDSLSAYMEGGFIIGVFIYNNFDACFLSERVARQTSIRGFV